MKMKIATNKDIKKCDVVVCGPCKIDGKLSPYQGVCHECKGKIGWIDSATNAIAKRVCMPCFLTMEQKSRRDEGQELNVFVSKKGVEVLVKALERLDDE